MARRPRQRQPNGRIFAMIETENGPSLHKLCAGPCQEMKPVGEFYRNGETWRSWCKLCQKPGDDRRHRSDKARAYWRSADTKAKANLRLSSQPPCFCVYVVQLVTRTAVVKIGRTKRLTRRLWNLRRRYGELRLLWVIPTSAALDLERHFQAQLKEFRVYEGTQPSELFHFPTKRAHKAFKAMLAPYAHHVQTVPSWESITQGTEQGQGQLALW